MSRSKTYCAAALAAGITMVLGVQSTEAGIVVSPLKQEVDVKPGRTAEFHISIANSARNEWDQPAETVHLEVMDFSVSEGGGLTFQPAGTVKNSASKWITLDKSDLRLAPGQGEKVTCKLRAPYSAVGEYYSAIMVTLGTKGTLRRGVTVAYRTASGVFVTVPGRTFPKQAKIVSCKVVWPEPPATQPTAAADPQAEQDQPVKVTAVLKNTGRARFEASGKLRITNAKGRIVYRTPMTTKRARVLPGDLRLFEAALDRALPPGKYTVKVEIDHKSKWSKARKRFGLTISAEQSALLATTIGNTKAAGAAKTSESTIDVAPERLAAKIPPGGFRALKVKVTYTGRDPVPCTAVVAGDHDTPIPASWLTLRPDEFTLRHSTRTLSLIVRVPSSAGGLYRGTLIVDILGTDGTKLSKKIPIELTIGDEK